MEIDKIVRKLIGPIHPVGETYEDNDRFDNLKTMTELVDRLLMDINNVAVKKNSHMASVSHAGKHAYKFIISVRDEANENI